MTERQWLRSGDAEGLHQYVYRFNSPHRIASPRKDRLLSCACVRRVKDLLLPEDLEYLDAIERVADGEATEITLRFICDRLQHFEGDTRRQMHAREALVEVAQQHLMCPLVALDRTARGLTFERGKTISRAVLDVTFDAMLMVELAANANLVREVYGNPFRPARFLPEWRTSTAIALASTMYESREFSAMPILADALQDAGCTNEDILNHCRAHLGAGAPVPGSPEPPPHVRGCWVLDLVLGKT